MRIVILNPAPIGESLTHWGDYHFGNDLAKALELRGHKVVQYYWPAWPEEAELECDFLLLLRGKNPYRPPKGIRSGIWILSHPSSVDVDELRAFDRIFVASETHWALLKEVARKPVSVLRQCTSSRFLFPKRSLEEEVETRDGIIFVANSRGRRRDMLLWAEKENVPVRLYGRMWDKVGFGEWVHHEYVDNNELPALYRSARLSLNDHWSDMRNFGVINNRVFDCLAAGLPVLTDDFPEARKVLGSAVLYANSSSQFASAVDRYKKDYQGLLEAVSKIRDKINASFTFDARAEQLEAELAAGISDMKSLPVNESMHLLETAFRGASVFQLQREAEVEESVKAQVRRNKRKVVMLRKNLFEARERINILEARVLAVDEALKRVEKNYAGVVNSFSWRMTAPFRHLMRLIRIAVRPGSEKEKGK